MQRGVARGVDQGLGPADNAALAEITDSWAAETPGSLAQKLFGDD